MYLRQVFMLFLFYFLHFLYVGVDPCVAFNECFLMVHDILVRGLLESIDGNGTEIAVVDVLDKLKLLLKHVFFFNRNVISHSIIIYNRLSSEKINII